MYKEIDIKNYLSFTQNTFNEGNTATGRSEMVSKAAKFVFDDKASAAEFFYTCMSSVAIAYEGNTTSVYGRELAQQLNDEFANITVITKSICNPNSQVNSNVLFTSLKGYASTIKKHEAEIAQKYPYLYNVTDQLINSLYNPVSNKITLSDRRIGESNYLSVFPALDAQQVPADQKGYYETTCSKLNAVLKDPNGLVVKNLRERISTFVDASATSNLSRVSGLPMPFDVEFGGISINSLLAIKDESERNRSILKFGSLLPHGDKFWNIFFSGAFMIPQGKDDKTVDTFIKITNSFGEFLMHNLFADTTYQTDKDFEKNFKGLIETGDKSRFIVLSILVYNITHDKNVSVQVEKLFPEHREDPGLATLSPEKRNLHYLKSNIDKIVENFETRFGKSDKTLTLTGTLKIVIDGFVKADQEFLSHLTERRNSAKFAEMIGVIDRRFAEIGTNALINSRKDLFNKDVIRGFTQPQEFEIDTSSSEMSKLLNLSKIELSNNNTRDEYVCNFVIGKGKLSAKYSRTKGLYDLSALLPNHESLMTYLEALVISSISQSTLAENLDFSYSRYLLLNSFGQKDIALKNIALKDPDELASEIEQIEGVDYRQVLQQRGFTQLLDHLPDRSVAKKTSATGEFQTFATGLIADIFNINLDKPE